MKFFPCCKGLLYLFPYSCVMVPRERVRVVVQSFLVIQGISTCLFLLGMSWMMEHVDFGKKKERWRELAPMTLLRGGRVAC